MVRYRRKETWKERFTKYVMDNMKKEEFVVGVIIVAVLLGLVGLNIFQLFVGG